MTLFLPALWFAAGVCLYAGVQFLIAGLFRRQERVFLSFGMLALLLSIYLALTTHWYLATSVQEVAAIATLQMDIVCLIYPAFVLFIGNYTGSKSLLGFPAFAVGAFAILLVANQYSSNSFLYTNIDIGEPLVFPWDEQVNRYDVKLSGLAWFYYACTLTVFSWAIWRCFQSYKKQLDWPHWPLTIYLFVQFLAIVHAQLIDILELRSVYLGEFTFLILVVLMSLTLGKELRRRTVELERSVVELREQTGGRRDAEEKLRHMAYHDYLTGLANRASLDKRLAVAIGNAREEYLCAVLLIDLDHFKFINDALGHDVGDKVLCQVAERLRESSVEAETVVRFGGDEFVILLETLPTDESIASQRARTAAERALNRIVQPYRIGAHDLSVGASIGVALFSGRESSGAAVLSRADMALSRAKGKGRNDIRFFEPQMEGAVERRLMLERELRIAIENGGLAVRYQPQLGNDGGVIGAEALLLWNHPKHGFVRPDEFIPIAEETGLILPLGEYALGVVCGNIRSDGDHFLPPSAYVAVNISS